MFTFRPQSHTENKTLAFAMVYYVSALIAILFMTSLSYYHVILRACFTLFYEGVCLRRERESCERIVGYVRSRCLREAREFCCATPLFWLPRLRRVEVSSRYAYARAMLCHWRLAPRLRA